MTDREGVLSGTVDTVLDYVHGGLSVHVVGPHASGRSELLQLVADRLDDEGVPVLRVSGHAAWQNEPFAALVVAGIGGAITPGPRRTVGEMITALNKQLSSGTVLVIDDADALDTYSVGALRNIHRQRRLLAVTSSKHQHPVSEGTLMLGIGPAVQVRPPVLDVEQVHEVCQAILGGPLEAGSLARITMATGGLIGLVRALATIGPRTGGLTRPDGLWTLPRNHGWTPELGASLEPFVAGLDQAVWDGATALAVTGPVPLDEAEKMLERDVLDKLFAAGLARHSDDREGGVVGLYPPMVGDYLLSEGSAYGLVIARNHLAADLRLPPGIDASLAIGADAALLHQRAIKRVTDAVHRARRDWSDSPTVETALPLLVALRNTSAPAEQIEEVVRRTPPGEGEAAARLLSWYAHWLAVETGDLQRADEVIDAGLTRLPEFAGLLEATRGEMRFITVEVPDDAGITAAEGDVLGAETLEVLDIERMLAAGRVESARARLRTQHPGDRPTGAMHGFLGALADILAGDLEAGIASALEQLTLAQQNESAGQIQAHAYVAVLGLTVAGRLTEANQLAFRTLASSTVAQFRDVYHTGILILGAEIALLQGRPDYARSLASQARGNRVASGPWPAMAPAIIARSAERRPKAADIRDLVKDRLDHGYLSTAIFVACEAVELAGDNALLLEVAARAAQTESPMLRALGRYIEAAATGDIERLRAARDRFEGMGAGAYATRAAVTLAVAQRAAGDLADGAATLDEAWERSEFAGYERSGMFRRAVTDISLSARESEVLRMLPSGRTTAELAEALEMSTRTVETHLHNISRKVGISGREELARAATAWLRPRR
ncbi:MAG: hypothetical protein J2O46_01865 [Nocardioides sp.]|nr:hypothetical protein [Nocardioides sp.]